jgi:hypothetical protein
VDRGYVEVPCGEKIAWESEFWRYGWILKNKLRVQYLRKFWSKLAENFTR